MIGKFARGRMHFTVLCAAALTLVLISGGCGGGAPDVLAVDSGVTRDYLVKCAGGYLLIDTGYEKHYDDFLAGLGRLGIAPGQVRWVLLTHHHDDHSGFAGRLLRESGASLIVHEKAYPFLAQGKPELLMKPLNWCTEAAFTVFAALFKKDKDHGFPPVPRRANDRIVKGDDGELLKSLGVNGTILHTPGHTDDSISVVLANGSAFVGDCAMDMLAACACAHRPIYANDYAQVYESWKKLVSGGAKMIYPSHGGAFGAGELESTMRDKPL